MGFDAGIALAAGLWATVVLTAILSFSLAAGWTHLDFGRLLGGILDGLGTGGTLLGLSMHGLIGLLFGLVYMRLFSELSVPADPLFAAGVGTCMGVYHWLLSMPLISVAGALNPHVRSGKLPNPGAWGIHFGPQEAIVRLLAHLVFGATMGALAGALSVADARHLPGLPWALITGLLAWSGIVGFHLTCLSPLLMPRVTFEPGVESESEAREAERRQLLERYKRGDITWDEYQRERRSLASEP